MARTATARKAPIAQRVESRAPSQRPPAVIAIERLAKLSAQNAPTHKIVGAAGEIIAGWKAGGIQPSTLRDQLEALAADLELGMEAAENYVSEAETDGQRKGATVQLEALTATRAMVMTELARA